MREAQQQTEDSIRRFIILGALVAPFVVPGPAGAHPVCHGAKSCPELIAMRHCEQGKVLSCIHRAALHRRVSYSTMLYIAHRESRYNPLAKNPSSTASGLFQFLTSTWYGSWNPYRAQSIWSAKANSLAAAYAMHLGYYSWWACC